MLSPRYKIRGSLSHFHSFFVFFPVCRPPHHGTQDPVMVDWPPGCPSVRHVLPDKKAAIVPAVCPNNEGVNMSQVSPQDFKEGGGGRGGGGPCCSPQLWPHPLPSIPSSPVAPFPRSVTLMIFIWTPVVHEPFPQRTLWTWFMGHLRNSETTRLLVHLTHAENTAVQIATTAIHSKSSRFYFYTRRQFKMLNINIIASNHQHVELSLTLTGQVKSDLLWHLTATKTP